MTGNVPLVPDPVRVNGFAGALPLPAPLSGDVSLSPDPVILSTAKDLDLPAPLVIPDLIGDLIVIPG